MFPHVSSRLMVSCAPVMRLSGLLLQAFLGFIGLRVWGLGGFSHAIGIRFRVEGLSVPFGFGNIITEGSCSAQ